jgi:hypothetical protein
MHARVWIRREIIGPALNMAPTMPRSAAAIRGFIVLSSRPPRDPATDREAIVKCALVGRPATPADRLTIGPDSDMKIIINFT